MSTRPARESGDVAPLKSSADPVMRKRPGPRILVNRFLECQDEIRRALNLVDHRGLQAAHEACGVVLGETPGLIVVQGDERSGVAFGNATGQGGLTGLTWTDQGDDAGISEGRADRAFGMTGH